MEEKEVFYDDYLDSYSYLYGDNEFENDLFNEIVKGEKNNNNSEEIEIPLEKQKTGITPLKKDIPIDDLNSKKDNIILYNPIDEKQIIDNILENENITEKKNLSLAHTKKALGRKRKNSEEKGIHNKYCEDNILRKIKSTILFYLLDFLNIVINKIYDGKIGKGLFKKELKKLNQKQIVDTKRNQLFLNKSLKDIFSEDISSKFTNFPPNQNKTIIENLLNERDLEKRQKFKNLFSLTFLNCLEHYRGTKIFIELKGFEKYDNIEEKFRDDKEYIKLFKYYISCFEEIIRNKRHRIKRK